MLSSSLSRSCNSLLYRSRYNTQRFLSSSSPAISTSCPFTGKKSEEEPEKTVTELKHIRSLPVFGSLFFTSYTGIPNTIDKPYDFWPELNKRFGTFYTMGFPIVDNPRDIYQTVYVTSDPKEFTKIIRTGGAYPFGMAELSWATRAWCLHIGLEGLDSLVGTGEQWKKIRTFFQRDLLHPVAADRYVPGFLKAAKLASAGAPHMKDDMVKFFERTAFDMINTLMLGSITNCANPLVESKKEDEVFVAAAGTALGESTKLMRTLSDKFLYRKFGYITPELQTVFDSFSTCWNISQRKVDEFLKRKEKNQLNELEEFSYFNNALSRLEKEQATNPVDKAITLDEVKQAAFSGLVAGVDTTSGKMSWNILHLARLPEVQEKLYKELSNAVETVGNGELTAEVLQKKNTPYLSAFIRETHRMTPVTSIFFKRVSPESLEVHGEVLQNNDTVILNLIAHNSDPAYVDNPSQFMPERWLEDAVAKRKGTPKEIIDHPLLKDPFSGGARKCPGSRVALNEVESLIATLVLDWKISLAPGESASLDDIQYEQKTVLVPAPFPKVEFEQR